MTAKPARLRLGAKGEVVLPADALEALELAPGAEIDLRVDTRRKQIWIERHVSDPWGEALKKKEEKGFEDLLDEQKRRDAEATRLFEQRRREPPPKRRPEDDPDRWK